MDDAVDQIAQALRADDAPRVRDLLERHPHLKARINDPIPGSDSPVILHVRSTAMLDALIDAGADLDAKSRWWAGGFGLLDSAERELALHAIARGATVGVHAAARLDRMHDLQRLVSADPGLVHARGGDGQTPLHFAATAEIARFLLEHGADIDARDVDHESTPAQYMVRDRQPVARYLVERGCTTDVLMAAALGDAALVRRHLDLDPDCVRMRVSDEHFPMVGPKNGGTIYQWTLGWYVSAHEVARQFGHEDVHRLLVEHSTDDVRLLVACCLHDEAQVAALRARRPELARDLSTSARRQVAHAARNDDLAAVRLMLASGLPVDARSQHGATPLHWAGFHGNAEMALFVLRYDPPLEQLDDDFAGTPLGWTLYGSEHGWHRERGDHAATAAVLLAAGAKPPATPGGTEAVQEVLRRHGVA